MSNSVKRSQHNDEEIPLSDIQTNSSDTLSVDMKDAKPSRTISFNGKEEDDSKKQNYFMLNKWENMIAVGGCTVLGYLLVSFSFTTMEIHKKTPIDGVTKNSFGLNWDTSDIQWHSYITNLHLLFPCSLMFLAISKLIKTTKSQILIRIFNISMGAGMFLYLFRGGFIFWAFLTFINYLIILTLYRSKLFPFVLWGFNIFLLFSNELNRGYNQVRFFHCESLQFLEDSRIDAVVQWNVVYNMTMLRIISFGMDKYWANLKFRQISKDKHLAKCTECSKTCECLKERYQQYHEVAEYSLINFLTYILYMPVLITGPPITFNAFLSQLKVPQNSHNLKDKIMYTLRTAMVFAIFILWNHINYGFALIQKTSNEYIWKSLGQKDLLCCVVNTLVILWMKFNCLWKYSRCWALWDDMEVPENMNRCVFNSYNFEEFWRAWHRGFNQWLIRYIYLPCGGSKTRMWNIWVVFTYVAIWHDLNLNLLLWAWGICFCLAPEIFVKNYVKKPKFNKYTQTQYWKYICAVAGGFYNMWLQFTNTVGFGMGYQTFLFFIKKAFSSLEGVIDILGSLLILSLLCLKLFELRERDNKNY